MKRTISIVLLLVCVLAASAQIQSNFLGFTLGETTKTQVYNHLRDTNIKFYQDEEGICCAENVKFATIDWDYAKFTFFNDKLYKVEFSFLDDGKRIAKLTSVYNKLTELLPKKYWRYANGKTFGDKFMEFSDNVTTVTFLYSDFFFRKFQIKLDYTDISLLNAKKAFEASDL